MAGYGAVVEALGRAGWAARAVLYLVTALLVTRVAAAGGAGQGGGGEEASHTGALQEIAEQPFGTALLAVLAVGLLAFMLWRFLEAWRNVGGDGAVERLGRVASGLAYGALGALAASMVLDGSGGGAGGGGGGGDQQAQSLTARVLGWPLGPWLVAGVGAGILAIGGYYLWRGITRDFMDDLQLDGLSSRARHAVSVVGEVGQLARAAVFGVVGWFVIKAAAEFDADEAGGLDHSLRELAGTSWGPPLLWAVALGLAAYGVFCAVRARYDRTTS